MSKLKLSIDQLAVESFASVDLPGDPGTVQGNEATIHAGCAHTGDRYDIQCRSVGIVCGPTEYFALTCVPTAAQCCNPTGLYLCGDS